jgi:prepilin-type N-terminal cleavage/methylation domain-containing protein
MRDLRSRRGFTLLELMVTVALMGILMTLGVQAFIVMVRSQRPRELMAQMQGEGRTGITLVETDLRTASLGAGTGVVWAEKGGNRVRRPAVQIYENVAGMPGLLFAKAQTDALLIVRAAVDGRASLVGDTIETNVQLEVTDAEGFADGASVLLGEYEDAAWIPIATVDVPTRRLTPSAAIPLYPSENATIAASGSAVRRARAFLYYVNTQDQLVRAELAVPYLPDDATQVLSAVDVARGVENLQIDCAVDAGAGLTGCPAPLAAGTEVTDEAIATLGSFGWGGGARLAFDTVPTLRTVTVSLVVRSRPLTPDSGIADDPIALEGVTLEPSVVTPGARFLRRAYRIGVAVRNTSLGSF